MLLQYKNIILRLVLMFFVITLLEAHAVEPKLLPPNSVILDTKFGFDLLQQCSRSTPKNVADYWMPFAEQIGSLESLLPTYLKIHSPQKPSAPLSDYYRQYLGVVSNGKKIIYVNFFHKSVLKNNEDIKWKKEPVKACDGGDYFWGIEFDPEKETFQNVLFNGEA